MKVTKDQLIEAFITGVVDINFNFKDDTLKLVLEDPKMSKVEFENLIGWLVEIDFHKYNQININRRTSLSGYITLKETTIFSKGLNLSNVLLQNCSISKLNYCRIDESKIMSSVIEPVNAVGSDVTIRHSNISGCVIVDSIIDQSSVVCKSIDHKLTLKHCGVTHTKLCMEADTITDKTFSSVAIDADRFNGEYFSIGFNGEITVGYLNKAEKVIVMGEKRYNLGSWEEQFIKKEQNQFVRMMNQKKLEMMNMFFDSLAFK